MKLVPPIKKVHSDSIVDLVEAIVDLHVAANADILAAQASRMVVFTASLAAEVFTDLKKSSANAILKYLVSLLQNLDIPMIFLQYLF